MTYQPGDILLDKYRIEALLGQGAFGDVYRVTHLRLNVPRAIKVLRRDASGVGSTEFNQGQQRFQLEAQLGARLNSPTPNLNLLVLEMVYPPNTDFQIATRILAKVGFLLQSDKPVADCCGCRCFAKKYLHF